MSVPSSAVYFFAVSLLKHMAKYQTNYAETCMPVSKSRRGFLITATTHATFLAAFSPSLTIAGSAEVEIDFAAFKNIEEVAARRLFLVAKTLFPHDFIVDQHYANAVGFLDRSLTSNSAAMQPLHEFLAWLPPDFEELSGAQREKLLRAHRERVFFEQFRNLTITAVYKNEKNWQYFGYPGPSLKFGGWVNRELVDIDWLPVVEK